jgi:hypothetical protein
MACPEGRSIAPRVISGRHHGAFARPDVGLLEPIRVGRTGVMRVQGGGVLPQYVATIEISKCGGRRHGLAPVGRQQLKCRADRRVARRVEQRRQGGVEQNRRA